MKSKELKGTVACKGKSKGPARIIFGVEDFEKFEKGDILVSKLTDPSYVMIMAKTAGIITELGGVTSHPAIIAREFNIPCIVGVQNATEIINDGDIIELDANKGIIKITS